MRGRHDREDDAEAQVEAGVDDAPLERPPVAQPEQRRRERGADVHARHPADEHVLPGHVLAPIEARHRVLGDVEEPGRRPGEPEARDLPELLDAPGATSPVHSAVSSPWAAPAFDEAAGRDDERIRAPAHRTTTPATHVRPSLDRFGMLRDRPSKSECADSASPSLQDARMGNTTHDSERTTTMTRASAWLCGVVLIRGRTGAAMAQKPAMDTPQAPGVLPSGLGDAIDRDVARVRAATEQFKSTAAAEAAGYKRVTDCVEYQPAGAMGYHFQNNALLDTTLDVEHPEVLVYSILDGVGQRRLALVQRCRRLGVAARVDDRNERLPLLERDPRPSAGRVVAHRPGRRTCGVGVRRRRSRAFVRNRISIA